MLNLYRLAIVLAVAAVCVTSPRIALALLCALAAGGCYTLLVLALPRLRRPTAAILRKA